MVADRSKLPFRKNCEGYFTDGKGNILAKKSEEGIVMFPGGGIDDGESIEKGMIRETLEEAGAIVGELKKLGKLNLVWAPNWAKTEKQKKRYEIYQGDEMNFFSGPIKGFASEKSNEEDAWTDGKFMKLDEVIKWVESDLAREKDNEYRKAQLKFLKNLASDEELAIFGGKKSVTSESPHYIWPRITKKTEEAVLKQLHSSISIYDRSGIIEHLEKKFSEMHETKHALLTNSGTMALFSLFFGAGLKKGDEVICPAYTFHATITPLFFTGAIPVVADCKQDGNIDPADIKRKITKKTKAIIVTHMWGIPCDMDEIVKIAKENKLLLFEDCSHAHFSKYKGKYVGTFGDAAAFSLQGQKTLTGGEGGILITNNDDIFYKALLLGHYNKRCKKEIPDDNPIHKYALTGMGLKLRIHPLAAAIAHEQLDSVQTTIEIRDIIAKKIINELKDLKGIRVPELKDKESTWYSLVIQYVPEELDGIPFKKFYEALLEEGCAELDHPGSTMPLNITSLFQDPSLLFPNYAGELNYKEKDFPNAEKFYANALKLPVWHDLKDMKIVESYIHAFKKVIKNYKELLNNQEESTRMENMDYKEKMNLLDELITTAKKEGVQKIVVGAVIKKKEKVLLLKRPQDDFMGGINELPSGNLEDGENLEEGLVREVKEETNLDLKEFLAYLGHFDYLSGSGKKARQFNFLISVKDGEIKLSEHDGFFWASKDEEAFDKVTESVKNILSKLNN